MNSIHLSAKCIIPKNSIVLIGIPCLLTGGTEMHTRDLVAVLAGAGYSVTVCCYYEFEEGMVREMEQAGARVRLLRLARRKGKTLAHLPRLALALRRVLRQERPAVFHVQYLAPGAFPVLVGRLLGVPWVLATLHTPGHVYGRLAGLLRFVANHVCHGFFCVSETAEKAIFGTSAQFQPELWRAGRRHFTIYNGVDTAAIDRILTATDPAALRRERGLGSGPVVGVVARLSPVKGHDFLLRSFARVAGEIPDARLLVVGDGESRGDLEHLARDLGIREKIVWAGRLSRAQVIRTYAAMDVVAVPSRFEGFGLSAAEAMAAGKPVVASDLDGLRDVVASQSTGILVGFGDEPGLAAEIIQLIRDKPLSVRMGAAGRVRVEKHFSMLTFFENWQAVYQSTNE